MRGKKRSFRSRIDPLIMNAQPQDLNAEYTNRVNPMYREFVQLDSYRS